MSMIVPNPILLKMFWLATELGSLRMLAQYKFIISYCIDIKDCWCCDFITSLVQGWSQYNDNKMIMRVFIIPDVVVVLSSNSTLVC